MHTKACSTDKTYPAAAVQACPVNLTPLLPFPDLLRETLASAALHPVSLTGPRRKWDDDEATVLRARYPNPSYTVPAIAGLLGRSPGSVRGKARRMGLQRPRRARGWDPAPGTPALDEITAPPLPVPPPPAIPTPLVNPRPAPAPAQAPQPFRLTRLGGREYTWSEDRIRRLILLWIAGYHHTVIAAVIGVGARAASTKATRISLPARKGAVLSRDLDAARRLDAAGGAIPRTLRDAEGRMLIGKHCSLTGIWFYAPSNIRTCPEAKQTLHYQRMQGLH